jgi:hypothetical protein
MGWPLGQDVSPPTEAVRRHNLGYGLDRVAAAIAVSASAVSPDLSRG